MSMRKVVAILTGVFVGLVSSTTIAQDFQPKPEKPELDICGVKFAADSQIAKEVATVRLPPDCHQQKDGRGLSRFIFVIKRPVDGSPDTSASSAGSLRLVVGVRYEETIPAIYEKGLTYGAGASEDFINTDDIRLIPEGIMATAIRSIKGFDGLFYICGEANRRAHSSGLAERVTICRSWQAVLAPDQINEMGEKILHDDINNMQM